jgi:hypothetical protein
VALGILDTSHALILAAASKIQIEPNDRGLPGLGAAEKLVGGLAKYVLLACLAGALLGIGQWVLGSRTSNYSQADSGRTKVAIAAGGAFLVGALSAIINFFEVAGGGVK